DRKMAVQNGLVEASSLAPVNGAIVSLEAGRKLYEAHVSRPTVSGGTRDSSQRRYRAVLDKIEDFFPTQGITSWNQVNANALNLYLGHLEKKGYAYGTQYLEGTTIKQIVNFLIAEKHLPVGAKITLKLRKPRGTNTHCWTPA